jgi:maleylacetate reductase
MSNLHTKEIAMRSGVHRFQAQERVIFGVPAALAVAQELRRLSASRVLLVTAPPIANGELTLEIRQALGARWAGTFSAIEEHSPRESVIATAAAARAANADLIVAIGGGSVMDTVKVAQQCVWRGVEDAAGLDALEKGLAPDRSDEIRDARGPIVRSVAVPTTFSGAEFTSFAGVTDRQRGRKELFDHPLQIPRSVVLDPRATAGVPEWVLMSTGIRAVDHCIETFCSPQAQPLADATALHALGILARALPALKADPSSLALRLECQLAMWLSILGPAAGVDIGASHGIGRVLGGVLGVPHGRTSCVLLPTVLRWNESVNAAQQSRLAQAMGGDANARLPDLVSNLVEALGEPRRLRDVGVAREQLDMLAAKALESGFLNSNPRPIRGTHDVLEILEMAW